MAVPADPLRLTLQQARNLHLAAQGLLKAPRRKARRRDVLDTIARMQLLQIDTIHVVARSPYLVLFSRLGDYKPEWLEWLLAQGQLMECWAHEACFAPAADFPLHRRVTVTGTNHWAMKHARRMAAQHRSSMDSLLAHVRERGAVKSSDFERADGVGGGGWWGWKSEKRWLEALFALGELMIARRERFQRVYDLPERVIARSVPHWNAEPPPGDAVAREFIVRSVRALGIAPARWIADYFRTGRMHRDEHLEALVKEGALLRVDVSGWPWPAYVHPDHHALALRAAAGGLRATHTTLLSPFDPVVWHRERAEELFGFEYRIECYTPAPKRKHGYFVLPILHRGRLVGRLDAKAHRGDGVFEVKSLFLEPDIEPGASLAAAIASAIQASANWHQTPKVKITRCTPSAFAPMLRRALMAQMAG